MKRKYIFNWEIEQTQTISENYHEIFLKNGTKYIVDSYENTGLYTTFLVQPENIIEDKETVLIPY